MTTTAHSTTIERIQAGWDRIAAGDPGPALAMLSDDIVFENGPGAGPWRFAAGKEAVLDMLVGFVGHMGGTFHQDGRCIHADERCAISLVHETAVGPDGRPFDNHAVYVHRLRADGSIDRVWTVDLDTEAMEAFWA